MRISLNWLADYVALPPADELARKLTGVGLEVEGMERPGAALAGVVAAKILASEPHPNAEKLSVTRVDAGGPEPLQVVCGAKNYKVGDVVPLAAVGTVLPGGRRIEKAKLRGVDSFGMLCSARELGLSADASGLLILPAGVKPGTSAAEAMGLDDVLLEVNVTPNRPDALSHVGVAREVAALSGQQVKLPAPKLAEGAGKAADAVKVRIEAPDRCPRYVARVVEGVKIGPSPEWMSKRLEACGVRSINNVVDATNFVLLELGHPLHAFDLDKVAGREIVVRPARQGERMVTLDGKERALDPDDLVIADRDRASALAGVMGGGDSEISPGTTRVLVESAYFSPAGIRRAARRHGLHTEASHRFERGADPGGLLRAADRCAELIARLAGGTVLAGAVDANVKPIPRARVSLRWARPGEILGVPVSRAAADRALASLGFAKQAESAEGAAFEVPSWRVDVSREEDLVEEIARELGFEAIPETLPRVKAEAPAPGKAELVRGRLREALAGAGYSEAVNFSFVSPRDLATVAPESKRIPVRNPLSVDQSVMRTSLLPGLLRNLTHNLRQRVTDVRLYELGRVYLPHAAGSTPQDVPAAEPTMLSGVLYGRRSPVGWAVGGESVDFYDAKAAVERALEAAGVGETRFAHLPTPPSWCHPRSACVVTSARGGERAIGTLGELHPAVAEAYGLPRGVFAFDLALEPLLAAAVVTPRFEGIPRFPAVLRDVAVVVDEGVPAGRVVALARAAGQGLVEEVTLFDVYRGAPIPAGRKNLAMALRYRSPERTLTDDEVDAAHKGIVQRLAGELGAELRA